MIIEGETVHFTQRRGRWFFTIQPSAIVPQPITGGPFTSRQIAEDAATIICKQRLAYRVRDFEGRVP